MKKIHLIVGLVAGGTALLLLSVFVLLAAKGQLNMETLTRVPILGRFFGNYVPTVVQVVEEKPAEKIDPSKPTKEIPSPLAMFQYPTPYSAGELGELSKQLDEAKTAYESKLAELAKKEEDIAQREKDFEQRWQELQQLAEKVEGVKAKLDQDFKALKDQKTTVDTEERANIQAIAGMFKKMKDAQKIADLLEEMGAPKTVKILDALSAGGDEEGNKKAAAVLALMKPDFATEVLNLTIKKKNAP